MIRESVVQFLIYFLQIHQKTPKRVVIIIWRILSDAMWNNPNKTDETIIAMISLSLIFFILEKTNPRKQSSSTAATDAVQ